MMIQYSVVILLINWVCAFFRGIAKVSALSLAFSRNSWNIIDQTSVGNNGQHDLIYLKKLVPSENVVYILTFCKILRGVLSW